MSTAWRKYQSDVAALFRAMGFDAAIEETVTGARATHVIDVVARLTIAGVPALWIVECKLWKASVRKEQVMTLAQIAQDVGADRAFLLSESGFQAGAIAAVRSTNVTLSSLQELGDAAADDISRRVLNQMLSEKERLEHQIRRHLYDAQGVAPDIIAVELDEVATLLGACLEMGLAISKSLVERYPIQMSSVRSEGTAVFTRLPDVAAAVQCEAAAVSDLAEKLDASARDRRGELRALADSLADEVDRLAELGDEAFAVPGDDPHREAVLLRCVESMRSIGTLADGLRPFLRGALLTALRVLWRGLIDGAYLALATPNLDRLIWPAHAATTRRSAAALRDALAVEEAQAKHSHIAREMHQ